MKREVDAAEKLALTQVTVGQWTGDLEVAVNLMDDDLREDLHGEGYDDPQAFVDAYCARHKAKFNETFTVN